MAWDTTSLGLAAKAVTDQGFTAALFNGDPNSGGTELTGGSPAYARKTLTFTETGATESVTVTFDIPAGAAFDHVAIFDGSTLKNGGGTSGAITPQSYASQGTFDVTVNVPAS